MKSKLHYQINDKIMKMNDYDTSKLQWSLHCQIIIIIIIIWIKN